MADPARPPPRGPGRRDAAGDPGAGGGGPRHPDRRRDPQGELLQPLRDRAGGRRRRRSRYGARPQRPPEPRPADHGPDPPASARPGGGRAVPAGAHRPDDQDHGAGAVHDVPAGAERALPRRGGGGHGLRRGRQRRGRRPVRGRRGRGAARRALHAGPPGRRPRVRAGRAERGARRRHRHDGGAPLLRLRRDHPRASRGLLVPAGAGRLLRRPDLHRDRAVRAGPRRPRRPRRQDDHPRGHRPVRPRGGDAADRGGTGPPRLRRRPARADRHRPRLRDEVPAAGVRGGEDARDGGRRRPAPRGTRRRLPRAEAVPGAGRRGRGPVR